MESVKDRVDDYGYAFLEDHGDEMDTIAVATALGEPLTPWNGGLVQQLVPRENSTPNTYSGIHGLNRFPFHTDLAHWPSPPHYLLLRCIRGYADIPTFLFDGQSLIRSELLNTLTRAVVRPRRPRNGQVNLLRICETTDEGYRLRWDETFLKPASKIGKLADQSIRDYLAHCTSIPIALARPGNSLLINNWRMLHARSAIPVDRQDRKIERIYLERLH